MSVLEAGNGKGVAGEEERGGSGNLEKIRVSEKKERNVERTTLIFQSHEGELETIRSRIKSSLIFTIYTSLDCESLSVST